MRWRFWQWDRSSWESRKQAQAIKKLAEVYCCSSKVWKQKSIFIHFRQLSPCEEGFKMKRSNVGVWDTSKKPLKCPLVRWLKQLYGDWNRSLCGWNVRTADVFSIMSHHEGQPTLFTMTSILGNSTRCEEEKPDIVVHGIRPPPLRQLWRRIWASKVGHVLGLNLQSPYPEKVTVLLP